MKNTDKLEDFIRNNKSDFDDLEPQDELWNNISKRLDNHASTKKNYTWMWKAAAVVFLMLSAGLLWERNYNSHPTLAVVNPTESDELNRVEDYYTTLINERRTEIDTYAKSNPELAKQFDSDLVQLDSVYNQLKTQILQNNNDQKVKDAMILNLQLRIEILNRQLNILQQIKQVKKDENYNI